MLADMFGTPLAVGQFVLYAEESEFIDERPELALYEIKELSLPNVIIAEAYSGDVIGRWFYLDNPAKRVAVIGSEHKLYKQAKLKDSSTRN